MVRASYTHDELDDLTGLHPTPLSIPQRQAGQQRSTDVRPLPPESRSGQHELCPSQSRALTLLPGEQAEPMVSRRLRSWLLVCSCLPLRCHVEPFSVQWWRARRCRRDCRCWPCRSFRAGWSALCYLLAAGADEREWSGGKRSKRKKRPSRSSGGEAESEPHVVPLPPLLLLDRRPLLNKPPHSTSLAT